VAVGVNCSSIRSSSSSRNNTTCIW